MAHFQGTIKEFTRFVGPFARIKVAFLASKYKKQLGKCEHCGGIETLDAAHIKGRERPVITATILSEFIDDGIINIDLYEFEDRFTQAHLPIESTIKVLCKKCHWEYDKKEKIGKEMKGKTEDQDESRIIESLINNQMNKSTAMKLAYADSRFMTSSNTIFSNIIPVQGGWWLQPFNDKFKTELHMILNDDRLQKLFVFQIPANTIKEPSTCFNQRNDKYRANCSNIYIPTDGTSFKEKNGFDFTPFLVREIVYT